MSKTIKPELWEYFTSFGFLIFGVYFLYLWRKSRNPKASLFEKSTGEWFNLITGISAIAYGVGSLIMIIYFSCHDL